MTPTEQDKELRESILQIQFDCWSDKGSHQPEKSSCQECNNQLTELVEQEMAKARIDELTLLADFQMGDITVMGRNERSWRDRISELEQNLLKELEEM